nr:MAG TPA: hypothetical protein [Caudoviricetes sp.]DAI18318.1 MAG TPA: hypothetical protein [Caudoviricetes sp.]
MSRRQCPTSSCFPFPSPSFGFLRISKIIDDKFN